MHHVTVKSSNIESVAYDPATRELHVRFKNGGTYSYEDVPAEKHAALMAAPSVGGYLHAHVRQAHKAKRVT